MSRSQVSETKESQVIRYNPQNLPQTPIPLRLGYLVQLILSWLQHTYNPLTHFLCPKLERIFIWCIHCVYIPSTSDSECADCSEMVSLTFQETGISGGDLYNFSFLRSRYLSVWPTWGKVYSFFHVYTTCIKSNYYLLYKYCFSQIRTLLYFPVTFISFRHKLLTYLIFLHQRENIQYHTKNQIFFR